MATQSEVKVFIDKISKMAITECNQRSKKLLPSVCIAQTACESA